MSSDMMISIYYLKKLLKKMELLDLVFTMGIGANRRIFPVIHLDLYDVEKRDDIRSSMKRWMLSPGMTVKKEHATMA